MEFAHTKEDLFDRWCTSKEVTKDYERLCQMILVEEFKSCLPKNIKTYIEEQKADSLQQAARLVDDCSLTHRCLFIASSGLFSGLSQDETVIRSSSSHSGNPSKSKSAGNTADGKKHQPRGVCRRTYRCIYNYCKRRGHVISKCWTLE